MYKLNVQSFGLIIVIGVNYFKTQCYVPLYIIVIFSEKIIYSK